MKYADIKLQHPSYSDFNCFFAFTESQFDEECSKLGLNESEVICIHDGFFGTKEGYERLKAFNEEKKKMIHRFCTAQEVYDYEYENCECDFEEDDYPAIYNVVRIFGRDAALNVKRKNISSKSI